MVKGKGMIKRQGVMIKGEGVMIRGEGVMISDLCWVEQMLSVNSRRVVINDKPGISDHLGLLQCNEV